MSNVPREYAYRPKWWIVIGSGALFAVGAMMLARQAASNDRGLVLNGLIEFGPTGATIFYWLLCLASVIFVAGALSLVFHRLRYRQRVALTAQALVMPVSRWGRDEQTIPYDTIRALRVEVIQSQRFLRIAHAGGNATIVASMLPSRAVFDEIRSELEQRMNQVSLPR